MKVSLWSNPLFAKPVLELLETTDNIQIISTITQKKSFLNQWSQKKKIPSFETPQEFRNSKEFEETEINIIVAYGQYIPSSIFDQPKYKSLNIHPSLLPKFRGASPVVSCLLARENLTGVSIMQLAKEMDSGPILAQQKVEIKAEETAPILSARLFQIGAELLIETIPLWKQWIDSSTPIPPNENQINSLKKIFIPPKIQEEKEATYCQKLNKESGKINWKESNQQIFQKYRAFYPWPGIWTNLGDLAKNKVKNKRLRKKECTEKRVKITEIDFRQPDHLAIKKVKVEGKKEISFEDLILGYFD